jgi:hypothetical protein
MQDQKPEYRITASVSGPPGLFHFFSYPVVERKVFRLKGALHPAGGSTIPVAYTARSAAPKSSGYSA